jgi:hypothetical protein
MRSRRLFATRTSSTVVERVSSGPPHARDAMSDVPQPSSPQMVGRLECLACTREADDDARHWRAYIGGGYEGDGVIVGIFCPECAEREFGE